MSTFANADGSSKPIHNKRTSENETLHSSNSTNKKIRISNSAWIISTPTELNLNATSAAPTTSKVQYSATKNQGNKSSKSDCEKLVTFTTATTASQESSDDLVIIRNIGGGAAEESKNPSSPAPPPRSDNLSNEYVVVSSGLMNSMDRSDFVVATTSTAGEVFASSTTSLETIRTSPYKDVCVTNVPISAELLEKASSSGSKKAIEEIELVLMPANDECDKSETSANNATRISDSVTCVAKGPTPNSASSLVCQSASLNNEITLGPGSASVTKTLQSTATMVNRVSVQSSIQSQPIMVTTKKFMPDVMQTTAKVSIGNTTISVPLLKPLNSKQLLNSTGFSMDTVQKQGQPVKYQQSTTNLSKILNIKRNQKGGVNQPTIVSLSQLQIKPVSTAKIVQAKVLGVTSDCLQKLGVAVTSSASTSTALKAPLTLPLIASDKAKCIANVKKVICSAEVSNTPPLLTPLSKYTSELTVAGSKTQTMNVSGALSIVKQNASAGVAATPQLITTTALNTTICSTAIASDAGTRMDMLATKAASALVRSKPTAKLSSITIPKNISLMLAKNSAGQQPKTTTLITSISGGGKTGDTSTYSFISTTANDSKGVVGNTFNMADIQTLHAAATDGRLSAATVALKDAQSIDVATPTGEQSPVVCKMMVKLPPSNALPHALDAPVAKRFKSAESTECDFAASVAGTTTALVSSAAMTNCAKRSNLKISAKASGNTAGVSVEEVVDIEPTGSVDSGNNKPSARDLDSNKNAVQQQHLPNVGSAATTATTTASNSTTCAAPKSEETHNVLLKQLLQNSSTTPAASQTLATASTVVSCAPSTVTTSDNGAICSQMLSNRKVINVRAPSLGHVSSLQAQLARPVIPPAPAPSTASIHHQAGSGGEKQDKLLVFITGDNNTIVPGPGSSNHSTTSNNKSNSSTSDSATIVAKEPRSGAIKDNGSKVKSSLGHGIISKETSFVSNPNGKFGEAVHLSAVSTGALPSQKQHQPEVSITELHTQCSGATGVVEVGVELTKRQQQEEHKDDTAGRCPINVKLTAPFNVGVEQTTTAKSVSIRIDTLGRKERARPHSEQAPVVINNNTDEVVTIGPQNTSVSAKVYRPATAGAMDGAVSVSAPVIQSKSLETTSKMPVKHDGSAASGVKQIIIIDKLQPGFVKFQPDVNTSGGKPPVESSNYAPSTFDAVGSRNATIGATMVNFQSNTAQADKAPPATPATATIKDADLRKKRKREYQKQRRQLLNSNKELQLQQASAATPTGGAAGGGGSTVAQPTAKQRRARKCSKIEEDYDGFIDNLMVRMRQMPPLEVQEPLLSRNFATGNAPHDKHSSNAMRAAVNRDGGELSPCRNALVCAGDYGRVSHVGSVVGLYDNKRGCNAPAASCEEDNSGVGVPERTGDKQQTVIQNDFYDQEFVPVIHRNDAERLTRFVGLVRDRNVEVLSTVQDATRGIRKFVCAQMPYPGLILTNKTTASSESLGRMSPVLETIASNAKRFNVLGQSIGMTALHSLSRIKDEVNDDYKTGGKAEAYHAGGGATVLVSLQLASSPEHVLGILRDLANLLHVAPFADYKLLEHSDCGETKPGCSSTECLSLERHQQQQQRRERVYTRLQQIITGRRKMCSQCGEVLHALGIRGSSNGIHSTPLTRLKALKRVASHLRNGNNNVYFCNRTCYDQYKVQADAIDNGGAALRDGEEHAEQLSLAAAADGTGKSGLGQKRSQQDSTDSKPLKCRFKYFSADSLKATPAIKCTSDRELMDALLRMDITVTARNSLARPKGNQSTKAEEDTRQCVFCGQRGDGLSDGASRLLNFEVDKWVHLNCALWSNGVYETVSGGLMNLQNALQSGLNQTCHACHETGATVKCFKNRCGAIYHLPCAIKELCVFYKNKTIQCAQHASRTEKENELSSLTVHRRVFVERDENCQVAAVMHHTEQHNLLRVGSLTFLNIGQLLPHQLEAFHTAYHIYPIGYKVIRLYWSMKRPNKRCRYLCSIAEVAGRPEFRIQVQESQESDVELRDSNPNALWQRILEQIAILRQKHDLVQLFPKFITGEDLFGLTEPTIVRIIESLPGIEHLTDYRFKYGRNPLLELPLAVNPSGTARAEPKQRQLLGWRKPHTQRTATTFNQRANSSSSTIAGEVACPYSKQFVHSKSSQYKKMKQEWRNNVYLARSKIQGLGLYAARDIEKHTMIIEYIGEVIRTEVSEIREKQYEAKNRGIYMFRLDEDRVVDATLSGGLARYINHSCNPNCVTETVEVDRELRIIIFAKRRINRGEELSYDYKFDIEDDANKIPCMCGTPNCRKWMN